MKHILLGLFLVLQMTLAHAAAFSHATWDTLLKKHVISLRNGQVTQVDYAGFKTEQQTLQRYLASTSAVKKSDFDRWPKNEQLAFLINSYNAWTIKLVLSEYPKLESIKDLGSFFQSPWKKSFIPLLGATRSLDDIEHGLIRGSGRYNDPRIHFAANCASIGCPALRPEAYVAERLETQLDEAATRFLSDSTRNRLEGNTLKLSSIFKWYGDDFAKGFRGANSLEAFLGQYPKALGLSDTTAKQLTSKKIEIDFLDYDWRLNRKS